MLPLLSLTFGLSFLSGLSLYLVTFLTSLAVQQGWIAPGLHPAVAALGHPAVLVISLLLFLTEFILDKVPWVDSLWDAVHTIIRPLGAGLLSYVVLQSAGLTGEVATALLASLGGIIALSSHLTKSGFRLIINASPEPFTNILASLAENAAVFCLLLLLIHAPVTGFATCLVLMISTWMMLPHLLRLVRTSLWLMWKKLAAYRVPPQPHHGVLPTALTGEAVNHLQELLSPATPPGTPAAAWAVPCITGKIRHEKALRAHHSGILISPTDHPATLVFIHRGWFRRGAVRLTLAGCTVRHDTSVLSENLAIRHPADGPHLVFRFPRGEAELVMELARDLRTRLGLEAPVLLSTTHRGSVTPLPAREPATTSWTPPPSLRH